MTTFGSLPGACHGPWCWTKTMAALEERGHRGVAIDLPCDDVTAGFDRYVEVTREAPTSPTRWSSCAAGCSVLPPNGEGAL